MDVEWRRRGAGERVGQGQDVGIYSVAGTWYASVGAGLQGSDTGGKRLPEVGEERVLSLAANLRR